MWNNAIPFPTSMLNNGTINSKPTHPPTPPPQQKKKSGISFAFGHYSCLPTIFSFPFDSFETFTAGHLTNTIESFDQYCAIIEVYGHDWL